MDYELAITKKQDTFNDWLYAKIAPYVAGDVLETGSGIGTFSEKIVRDCAGAVYLTDINQKFIDHLRQTFAGHPQVTVAKLDLGTAADFAAIGRSFDTIVCANVLEHVQDDVLALKCMGSLLKPKGKIVLLVPCHQFLFSALDTAEGHFRRYSKKDVEAKAARAGFTITAAFWFNFFAIPGRWVNGNLLRAKQTHAEAFGWFNRLVPVFRFIEEKMLVNVIGVSRIAILEPAERPPAKGG